MSGLQIVSAVAEVVSVFHSGADLVAQVKKKARRRKSQQMYQEQQLQESLEAGKAQVAQRFAADCTELGEIVKRGDAIARDRLKMIAVVMQAEIIRSLQLAVKFDNTVLNLNTLLESSIMNRKDAIVTLDELKQRILLTAPLEGGAIGPVEATTQEVASMQAYHEPSRLKSVPYDSIPPTEAAPAADVASTKSGLARYFSKKRHSSLSSNSNPRFSHRRVLSASSAVSSNPSFSPALNHLLQGADNKDCIMKDIDEVIGQYQTLNLSGPRSKRSTLDILNHGGKRDTLGLNQEAIQLLRSLPVTPEGTDDPSLEYPGLDHNTFLAQKYEQNTSSQYFAAPNPLPERRLSRLSTSSSVYSDTVPPSLTSYDSPSSHSSSTPPTEMGFISRNASPTLGSASPVRIQGHSFSEHGSSRPSSTRLHLVPHSTHDPTYPTYRPFAPAIPTTTTSISGPLGYKAVSTVSSVPSISMFDPAPGLAPSTSHSSGASSSFRTATVERPSGTQDGMMDGRPCKENNYWGFCKGAWSTREELKKGLSVQVRPEGMYNMHQIWQCKHCYFSGEVYNRSIPGKKKKEAVADPKVHTSAIGLRYKWIFLAKSHVKKKNNETAHTGPLAKTEADDINYGCVICSVEGHVTGIFGNVETLMNHIFLEHASVMSEQTTRKTRCIVGREAGPEEDWDLNIPRTDLLAF